MALDDWAAKVVFVAVISSKKAACEITNTIRMIMQSKRNYNILYNYTKLK